MQGVLSLQTPVRAKLWLVPRMAPSASGAWQRQIMGCHTSAFLVAPDALVRASLPARLAFVEGLAFIARSVLGQNVEMDRE